MQLWTRHPPSRVRAPLSHFPHPSHATLVQVPAGPRHDPTTFEIFVKGAGSEPPFTFTVRHTLAIRRLVKALEKHLRTSECVEVVVDWHCTATLYCPFVRSGGVMPLYRSH